MVYLLSSTPPMSSVDAAFQNLPAPILEKLESTIRRVRLLLLLKGGFATLATGLASLVVIMAIDASMTLFSPAARWALSLSALALTLVAAWWFLVRPLSRRFTLTRMARILEIRHPELQERISTAVELLSSDDPESIKGSRELIEAVVDSAVDDVGGVDPRSEFRSERARRFMLAATVLASVVALSLAIWPRQSWTLLARAVAPFLEIGNAYANTLTVEPGDFRLVEGDSLTVTLAVAQRRVQRAELRLLRPDGGESIERMTPAGEDAEGRKRFVLTFPKVDEGFHYRVRAGSALSRYFAVETVSPPAIQTVRIETDFPEYTGLPRRVSDSPSGEIRALNRSRVAIAVTTVAPVEEIRLFLNDRLAAATPASGGREHRWEFDLAPAMAGSWHLEMTDLDGFSSLSPTHSLEVLPDKAPVVQIVNPGLQEITLRPTERLPIDSRIVEDYGVRDVTLLVTPEGSLQPLEVPQPAAVRAEAPETYLAASVLDLSSLALAPDQRQLALQVRVRDNRPPEYDGPGTGLSETLVIRIDEKAKSFAEQLVESQRREVGENLREAKRELERARDDLRQTERELQRSDEINERARKELEEFTERSAAARDRLDEVAAALDRTLFHEQSVAAREIADGQIAEAREQAELIPLTDDQQARAAEATGAREKIEEAIREVDAIADAMKQGEDDYRAIAQLGQIANRQQDLANRADDEARRSRESAEAIRSPADEEASEESLRQMREWQEQQRRAIEQFQREQRQVQQQLGEMLKDNAAALEEVLAAAQSEADAFAEEAAALAQQQESLRGATEEAGADETPEAQSALRESLLAELGDRQQRLAEEATRSAAAAAADPDDPADGADQAAPTDSPAAAEPSLAEALRDAAAVATEAAEALRQENLDAAATSARAAADTLAQASERAAAEPAAQSSPSEAAPAEPAAPADPSDPAQADAASPTDPSDPAQADAAPPSDPSVAEPATPPAPARELAQRQEILATQIEAVQRGEFQQALGFLEQQLNAEAAALQAQSSAFEETMRHLSQGDARSLANEAGQSLRRGGDKAAESARQLSDAQDQQRRAEEAGRVEEGEIASEARSRMQRGQQAQAESRDALEAAAGSFQQLMQAIGESREGLEPSDADSRLAPSEEFARGFEEVSEAARASDAETAAEQARQAADALQQLAQSAMRQLGSPEGAPREPGEPGESGEFPPDLTGDPDSESLNESGMKTADAIDASLPREFERLGLSVQDWQRLRGSLSSGNASAIETELPAEYRELIGRYFQVIAKEAAQNP